MVSEKVGDDVTERDCSKCGIYQFYTFAWNQISPKCLDATLGWILLTFRPIERYGKHKSPGTGTARKFYLLSILTTLEMSSDWAARRVTIYMKYIRFYTLKCHCGAQTRL